MLVLNQNEIKQLISMDEAIDVTEKAYIDYSSKRAQSPLRFNMQLDQTEDFALFMPGFSPALQGLGVKVVTIFPENVKKDLPATQGVILLSDTTTGVPTALMDGTFITALRTGAGSGVATKYLASEQASSVAVIGTGGMAPGQLEAVCCVRDIKEVFVYNRTTEKAEKFVEDMKMNFRNELTYVITSTPEEAVRQADVIVTSTASPTPVVKYQWLKKGAHVNAIGAFNADLQEVDEELVARAEKRVVDGISAASVAGDLAIPLKNKTINKTDLIEIGDLISNNVDTNALKDRITYFKTVGLSVQDIATAVAVLEKAKKAGIGLEINLS